MLIATALALCLGGLPGQDAPDASAPDDGLPPTRLATELLATEPLVALVRTVSTTNFGIGTAVVRMVIEERLYGGPLEKGDEAVVFAYAGHFAPGGRDLVYLRPHGTAGRWAVLERVDGRDRDYRAKVDATRRTLALTAIRDRPQRERATVQLLFDLLERPDPWSRGYAVGELRWMARHHRALFTEEREQALLLISRTSPHADVQAGVESVTILLSLDDGSLRRPPQSESSSR